ncbi:HpcH/HpaI aldolase/citrate lyase family protein [Caenimonas terrae]|uniref:HpcH/HpaI aldolase/citrate lyase family protein n=1 Tax=Caenimonas terrae TaxID=696074 RepID=A0ABW0NK14_9BURK
MSSNNDLFRDRLRRGDTLVGSFVKTPTLHATEILAQVGYDFVVIDAEHAPLDRSHIDVMLYAARAGGIAGLVRVPAISDILSALDCGAVGVLVPHVDSPERAREAAAASRYRNGRRGYSGATRSSNYGGGSVWSNVDAQDAQTTVIAMIEDPQAVEQIEAIAAVDGIDAFFIGRGDLTVAYGAGRADDPVIVDAVRRISDAGRAAGKAVVVMVNGPEEAAGFEAMGASAFIVSTDQGLLRRAATAALAGLKALSPVRRPGVP